MKFSPKMTAQFDETLHAAFQVKPHLNDVVAAALAARMQDQLVELLQCMFMGGHVIGGQMERSRIIPGNWLCRECGYLLEKPITGDGTSVVCKDGHGLMHPLTEADYIRHLEMLTSRAEVVVSAYVKKHGKLTEEELNTSAQESHDPMDLMSIVESMEDEGLKVIIVKVGGDDEEPDPVGDA